MATLYITEYANSLQEGGIQIAMEPMNADQTVAIAGASAASAAFQNNTRIVRLETDSICSVKFGTAPVVTTSNRRMQAGDVEYFGVPIGAAYKVAVISNT